jgi:glycosyltransferase involved in cell wall biosynthesis
MSNPLVSVVIPVYNGERFLKKTLESVFAQTFRNYEVVCVDDGSTDKSRDIISEVSSGNAQAVRLFCQNRGGQSASRNAGVSNSSGQYLAFLDQDDIWYPHKLAQQVAKLENNSTAVLVHCDHDLIDEDGKVLRRNASQTVRRAPPKDWAVQLLGPHAWILPTVFMVRRAAFERIGGFDPALRYDEDADLCLRINDYGESVFIEEAGAAHRVHGASAGRRTDLVEEHFLNGERFCRKLEVRFANQPDKRRLVRLLLASKLSDWGWHKVHAGDRTCGIRLLACAVSYDPFRLRTYSRLLRALLLSRD